MSEQQRAVPAIPDIIRNKTFVPADSKWVKTVNDKATNSALTPGQTVPAGYFQRSGRVFLPAAQPQIYGFFELP